MNVLELVQSACYSLGASNVPSSLLATDFNSRQLKNFMLEESRFLRSQNEFIQAKKKHLFTTVVDQTKYALPIDYYAPLENTQWDNTNRWQMLGPLNDAQFTYMQQGWTSIQNWTSYRLFGGDGSQYSAGGQFEIYPAPTTGTSLGFEYISKNMFTPPYWTPSTVIAAGAWIFSNGNFYNTVAGGTTAASGNGPILTTAIPLDGTVQWVYQNVLYENIISNSDLSVFDDEVMISGIKWRFEKSKGTAFDLDPNTGVPVMHMKVLQAAVTRWLGSYTFTLYKEFGYLPYPNCADGGWNI